MSLNEIRLRKQLLCPHCDTPLDLMHDTEATDLTYVCKVGCKAEYGVSLIVGTSTLAPVCGAKRVSTRAH